MHMNVNNPRYEMTWNLLNERLIWLVDLDDQPGKSVMETSNERNPLAMLLYVINNDNDDLLWWMSLHELRSLFPSVKISDAKWDGLWVAQSSSRHSVMYLPYGCSTLKISTINHIVSNSLPIISLTFGWKWSFIPSDGFWLCLTEQQFSWMLDIRFVNFVCYFEDICTHDGSGCSYDVLIGTVDQFCDEESRRWW